MCSNTICCDSSLCIGCCCPTDGSAVLPTRRCCALETGFVGGCSAHHLTDTTDKGETQVAEVRVEHITDDNDEAVMDIKADIKLWDK